MKELFHIEQDGNPGADAQLLLALGDKHCCLAVTDAGSTRLLRLVYLRRDAEPGWGWEKQELDELRNTYTFLQNSFSQVKVCYQFADALLSAMGTVKREQADPLATTMSANPGQLFTETVPGWQLETWFKIPSPVTEWIGSYYQPAVFIHQYTLAIKHSVSAADTGSVCADIRQDELVVTITRSNRVMLVQTFTYSTPEDVLYHLLNSCRHFSLSAAEVSLQLSGLLEERSALYRELQQYFRHLSFREAGWNCGKDYPAHFFTTLNDLALCAS